MLVHMVGALVMSRAGPDDSPLADEILTISRDKILGALSQTETVSTPEGENGVS